MIEPNIDGEYFLGIILISVIGSIFFAEKKAKNSKEQEIKKNENFEDLSV